MGTNRFRPLGWALLVALVASLVPLALLAQEQPPEEEPYSESVTAKLPPAIPDEAKRMRNPFPASAESLERGGRLFASQCAMCHGARGAGDGSLASSLRMEMPDFRRRSKRTDGELFHILTEGHGRMPADGERFSAEWRWDMINFVRSLSG